MGVPLMDDNTFARFVIGFMVLFGIVGAVVFLLSL